MTSEYNEENINDFENEDTLYHITPWGCLYVTLIDYGIDVNHISGRVGNHIVEDFTDIMEKAGYLSKVNDQNDQEVADD